jgi:hypothetical protein
MTMNEMQNESELRICERCVLPETFPGIVFDNEGVCKHCRREESAATKASEKKAEYRERLDQVMESVKGRAPVYDAIVAYSGGKDSSYTLKLLKDRYDLRLVALTLDNHFVSPAAWENIGKVVDTLEVDHIRLRPSWPVLKRLFRRTAREDIFPVPTLLRASAICTACIGIVKSLVLKTSLEMSIPLVAFGWSPGQAPIQSAIMKTNSSLIQKNQEALKNALPLEIQESMEQFFIPENYYGTFEEQFPYNIHPLAFFDYNEEIIKRQLGDLGWQAPDDTDTNSTNCLLNAFANQAHIERHGFHPYVWEVANMVRQGVMSREEGKEKIYTEQNREMVKYAKERLDL